MTFWVGTSGFSYPTWKVKFYPKELKAEQRLSFYSARFPAVEINSSFYRLPVASALASWMKDVPASFLFAFKAPGTITHRKWTPKTPEIIGQFTTVIDTLGRHLGPALFQFPPYLKKDLPFLRNILNLLPKKRRHAFEFRHPSWFDEELYDLLREHAAALVFNDADMPDMPFVSTAPWGYLRLRKTVYSEKELSAQIQQATDQDWKDVFVFFKHEDEATGPALASRWISRVEPKHS